MNIYDEAKVITHGEARKNVQECYGMVKTNMTKEQVWDYEHKNIETQIYISQQEKKDERAKKVEELLELYRKQSNLLWDEDFVSATPVEWEIDDLEKELEEKE